MNFCGLLFYRATGGGAVSLHNRLMSLANTIATTVSEGQWILTAEEYAALPGYKRIAEREENHLRYQASGLVQNLGMRLKLPQVTIATAQVFLHRFYIRESFQSFPYAELAPAALFLASKADEHPRKIKDVLIAQDFALDDSRAIDRLVKLEKIILQTLCFDLVVTHPYRFVFRLVKGLREVSDELVQSAWIVVNDSYRTALCIRFPPKTLAAAAIFFAARKKDMDVALLAGDAIDETTIFECSRNDIEEVTRVLDDLYSGKFKEDPATSHENR